MTHNRHNPRRAVVLLAVLVVVVLLSLAAYKYSDYMLSEARATESAIAASQARMFADSGVHYTAALLAGGMDTTLGSNPWDNPAMFQNIQVPSADSRGRTGRFTVLSLRAPDDMTSGGQAYRYGVSDEGGKINLNALPLLERDPARQGTTGLKILMALPNMTEDIAKSILAWLGCQQFFGQEAEYYSTQNPPYRMKMGPLDSLEELLLVKGVTPQLLFGNDKNRNGALDPDEGEGQADLGWSAYLTVYSRESNADSTGKARININGKDVDKLSERLTVALGQDLANYIVAYRMYGGSQVSDGTSRGTTKGQATKVATADASAVMEKVNKDRANKQQNLQNINSLWDLVNSQVTVTTGEGNAQKQVSFPSPLNDDTGQRQLLPKLLDMCSTSDKPDVRSRINVLTAPPTVLATLKELTRNTPVNVSLNLGGGTAQGTMSGGAPTPILTDADIQTIISKRPAPETAGDNLLYRTAAWLVTDCNLPVATVKALDRYVTGRTQVYRFQAIGYYDRGGPTSRIEAVVDTNMGRPRIVYWRDLSELGKGFDLPAGR